VVETTIAQAEDVLRTLTLDPATPDFWTVRIDPTDTPLLRARQIGVDEAIRTALDRRSYLDQQRRQMTNTDTNIRYFTNQRLPDVNVAVNYALTGIGGTHLIRGDGFPGPVIELEERALGDLLSNQFPTWTVGVSGGYPFGRSTADANLTRARLQALELQVTAEVREVGRRVTGNRQRVEATRLPHQLPERRLEAEQKKFDIGMSTSFFVFHAQRDLTQSRRSELQAILDYIKSLVDFEAAQEVQLGGGAIFIPTAAGVAPTGFGTAATAGTQAGGRVGSVPGVGR
jgi:outer membrane protein TolC